LTNFQQRTACSKDI